MATIKSYTDLEQSRKLAEILRHESADMYYRTTINGIAIVANIPTIGKRITMWDIPCWSLAALLGVLPNENMLVKTTDGKYYCLAKDVMTKHYDNPIDACYEMIVKLHELKML